MSCNTNTMEKIGNAQTIEDNYINKGYRGSKLEKILQNDKEYQKLLEKKKSKIKNLTATKSEKQKYVLATAEDFKTLTLHAFREYVNA